MTNGSVDWNKGRLYSQEVSSASSGFRLGDGVFETIRTYNGKAFRLDAHITRLLSGAETIGLRNLPNIDLVIDQINQTLKKKGSRDINEEWIIRPTFFSDDPNWGFVVPIESWRPRKDSQESARISIGISSYQHPGNNIIPPTAEKQVKWLSRGPLSHALRAAREKGWEEALLLDSRQKVIEGTRSNVFAVSEEITIAPGVLSGAFPGITREVVIECAKEREMKIVDRPLDLQELRDSKEVFLTSTLLGIAPVRTIVIGQNEFDKLQGETSKLLMSDFNQKIIEECHSEIA